ncbi:MAG: sulfite exporter TauE/SafE family protein, partial [Myxococcota bacterium]
AAVAGSPHCLGMCGALACAAGGRASDQAAYHLGRIATYAALGALSGVFGQALPGPAWVGPAVAAVFLIGFAASLAGILPEPRIAIPGLAAVGARFARSPGVLSRLAFGVVNGLLPCGLVYASLALAVAAADPLRGAAVMAVFGLFTVPALVAASLGLRKVLARSVGARRALAAVVLVAGLATLGFRAGLFTEVDPDSDLPPCQQAR